MINNMERQQQSHRRQQQSQCQKTSALHYSYQTISTLVVTVLSCFAVLSCNGQQAPQDPLLMNGGSVLAMTGDQCIALAVDKRFGSGMQMVNIAPRKVLIPSPHLMVAFTGLEGDVQTLSQELSIQVTSRLGRGTGFMKANRNYHEPTAAAIISPRAMASLTSHVLHHRRSSPYYVEPMVVGLIDAKTTKTTTPAVDKSSTTASCFQPFLCSMDMIGAKSYSDAFCCSGAASQSLYGTAEASWKPGLKGDDLVRVCGKAFLSALERDCYSGYGAVVYLITPEGITEFELDGRND